MIERGGIGQVTNDELIHHPFVKEVFEAARPIMVSEREHKQSHPAQEWLPDEADFHVLRVGRGLALLLSLCEQLTDALSFLTTYRSTRSAVRAGASRDKYLRFVFEGYIVRTKTAFDLALKLVDAVFHLTNADSACRDQTVMKNQKVGRTKVPAVLKAMAKHLETFAAARNVVVHHGAYRDDTLYALELYAVVDRASPSDDEAAPAALAHVREGLAERTREFVDDKRKKGARFNGELFQLMSRLFDELQPKFAEQQRDLRRLVGRNDT